ncbi:MAG: N-acetylmuramic acid 6-phosphate etherase [Pseudomonadota bacterium]
MQQSKKNLRSLSIAQISKKMNEDDIKVISSIKKELPRINKAIREVVNALSTAGRLFYIGAGTSGRLGYLDAAELAPTFSVFDDQVIPIMAGGKKAIYKAVEGAEDDKKASVEELKKRKLNKNDICIGISASGTTPFTLSALNYAKRKKAFTILVTTGQNKQNLIYKYDIVISPSLGEEIILGSSRLKAGTSQKIILNMISTLSMIKLGKTYGNLMTNVACTNEKLRKRQLNILSKELNISEKEAHTILKSAKDDLKVSILSQKQNISVQKAFEKLKSCAGNLEKALLTGD